MRLPSYLQVSPYGIYYFRSVFPKSIQVILHKREFKRSLKTTCRHDAIHLSRIFKLHLDKIFLNIQKYKMDWQQTQTLLDKIANSIISEFKDYVAINGAYPDNIDNYPEKQAEEDAHYYLSMKQFPLDHPDIDLSDEEIEQAYGLDSKPAEDIRWRRNGAKLSSILSINSYANTIIEKKGLKIESENHELFCQKVAEMLLNLSNERKSFLSSFIDSSAYDNTQDNLNINLNQKSQDITPINNNHVLTEINTHSSSKHLLTELFYNHLNYLINIAKSQTQQGSIKYIKEYDLTYNMLKFVMNVNDSTDIYIEDVKREHVTQLKHLLEKLPKRIDQKFKDLSVNDICRYLSTHNRKLLAPEIQDKLNDIVSLKTMQNYTAPIRTAVDKAVDDGIVDFNVFSSFKFKVPKRLRDENKGKPFTHSELYTLFSNEIFAKKDFKYPYQYWVPLCLLFTGARRNDICYLKVSDIIIIDSIYCIDIEKSKTPSGTRVVPLHSTLIKLGFLDFVAHKKHSGCIDLFDELEEKIDKDGRIISKGNAVSKWFNIKSPKDTHVGYLNKCNIVEKGKKLHSFRHTFINNLKQQRIQVEEVKEIVGHVSDDMTFSTYAEPYKVKILKDVVEQIHYKGVRFPWITNKHYKKISFPWEK